jgi:hypothetical protein
MTHHQELWALRGPLVRAAEASIKQIFNGPKQPDKAQLSHLVGVCNAAACGEEIQLYLRYQASRDRASWTLPAVEDVIQRFVAVVKPDAPDREALTVAAWRLYAVYLARSFTYEKKAATERPTGPAPNERRAQLDRQDTRPSTTGQRGGRR